jgi:hypothetical protein
LNIRCSTALSALDIQNHMLKSSIIIHFYFGVLYGFILMKNTMQNKKYLVGLWRFTNFKKFLLKILVYLLCAALPAYAFVLLSELF